MEPRWASSGAAGARGRRIDDDEDEVESLDDFEEDDEFDDDDGDDDEDADEDLDEEYDEGYDDFDEEFDDDGGEPRRGGGPGRPRRDWE